MPCNGTKDKEVMGNLNEQSWEELWNSEQAENVRKKVRCCDRDCWMIGSVSPAMHKYIWVPAAWVIWHKCKALFMKKPYSMYENKIVRDYRDGKVTKEQLIEKLREFKGVPQELKLPSAPAQFIQYLEEDNRPQVTADVDFERGMGISVGRLREDAVYDYKFIGLSHNTVRGAAGGAVLCAELLTARGYI